MSEITKGVIGMPFELAMGSELSRRQFHSAAQELLAENLALHKVARELRRWATCEHLHHEKVDQHEADEPCKVLARIDKALKEACHE